MTVQTPPQTVRVLVYAPYQEPREELLPGSTGDAIKAIGELVGGYVESMGIGERLDVLYNEAGNDGTLAPNRLGMYGTFVVVGRDGADVIRSLSDEEIAAARDFVERYAEVDLRH